MSQYLDKKRHSAFEYAVWIIFALIFGIILAYFLGFFGQKLVSYVFPSTPVQALQSTSTVSVASASTAVSEVREGADDAGVAINESVVSDNEVTPVVAPVASNISNEIKVSAKAYLVGDITDGKIIVEKLGTSRFPQASVTKLMTILVTKKYANLQNPVSISKNAVSAYGTEGNLVAGENIRAGDLTYPLLLESSNDAAVALAENYGYQEFLDKMNEEAALIGMMSTKYMDSNGLTPQNVTTVEDLFKLAKYIFVNRPDIFDVTRVKEYSILHHTWRNHNKFLSLSNFIGGKNGFTDEALQTTVSLFSVKGKTVAIILLQSSNREGDVATILKYLKDN